MAGSKDTKKRMLVEIMLGGESTITREMNAVEIEWHDFFDGDQWTPEQVAKMQANRGR